MKKKILLLAANPVDSARLRIDREAREISERLLRAKNRDFFEVIYKLAIRTSDIYQALLDHEPHIVHFSGHGNDKGLMVEDDMGNAKSLNINGLSGLFGLFKDQVECVLMNTCYSEVQAKAINRHIYCVIGMSQNIVDRAAIEFSIGFYSALGAGKPYEIAFKLGINAVQLQGIQGYSTPVLLIRTKVRNKESSSLYSTTEKVASEELYEVFVEKMRRIKQAYAIETMPARKFQLEKQLEEVEKDINKLFKRNL